MQLLRPHFTTLDEAFAYLETFTNFEKTAAPNIRSFRLDRMRALLDHFGNPERSFRSIHIAGTKGKGSTAIFLAEILTEAGVKTGMYTSPHVSSYRERVTLAGEFFEDALYIDTINEIVDRLAEMGANVLPVQGQPTTFELLTLLGFLCFRKTGCSWAVIETGIGGRLDATNVILPVASVLTPVEKEHVELLGTTLPQIAGEKAGIIKAGVPAFSGFQHPEVRAVFAATAALKGAPIRFLADAVQSIDIQPTIRGSQFSVRWKEEAAETFDTAMAGEVQAENAALAVMTARALFGQQTGGQAQDIDRPMVKAEHIRRALLRASLPGRMEFFDGVHGPIVLDGAHTRVSVTRLVSSFQKLFSGGCVLLFGSVLGKDAEGMAEVSAGAFDAVIISTPGTFKKSDPEAVFQLFSARNPNTHLRQSPAEALELAEVCASRLGVNAVVPILVTGSFYMVAEIRALLLRRRAGAVG